jgi:hypothetical protein
MQTQGQLNFEAGTDQGYSQWLTVRSIAAKELARRLQLPIGRVVEVWLHGNIRLQGILCLKDSVLFVPEDSVRHLPLRIDKVDFTYRDIESCVALD